MDYIEADIKTREEMLKIIENIIDSDIEKAYMLANWLLDKLPYYELKKVYNEFKKQEE